MQFKASSSHAHLVVPSDEKVVVHTRMIIVMTNCSKVHGHLHHTI